MTLLPAHARASPAWPSTGCAAARLPPAHAELDEHGFWYRWSRVIQRRPWTSAASPSPSCVVLALPVLSMHLLFTDSGNDPTSLTTRRAYDLLSDGFGPGANGPLVIAVDLPAGRPPASPPNVAGRPCRPPPGVAAVPAPQTNHGRRHRR